VHPLPGRQRALRNLLGCFTRVLHALRNSARMRRLVGIGFVISALLLALAASPASAETSCAAAVLRDWHNGHISTGYAPECYRAALAGLPEDMRIYSSAEVDIETALHARLAKLGVRRSGTPRRALSARTSVRRSAMAGVPDPPPSPFPWPVVVAAGSSVVLVSLASISRGLRKRRT